MIDIPLLIDPNLIAYATQHGAIVTPMNMSMVTVRGVNARVVVIERHADPTTTTFTYPPIEDIQQFMVVNGDSLVVEEASTIEVVFSLPMTYPPEFDLPDVLHTDTHGDVYNPSYYGSRIVLRPNGGDTNWDGDVGNDTDIAKFFSCLGGNCPGSDYDGDGQDGTDADIQAFFACLGGRC